MNQSCGRCMEDLTSVTRYVTWSLHTKSKGALEAMLRRVRLNHDDVA